MGKLRGKTYPDTETEQFAALETDETLVDYKEGEIPMRFDSVFDESVSVTGIG